MIQVKYEKKDNYPHDRKTLLFDRSGFQHTHRDVLCEINKEYNILCPQIFIMECLAPQNTDRKTVNLPTSCSRCAMRSAASSDALSLDSKRDAAFSRSCCFHVKSWSSLRLWRRCRWPYLLQYLLAYLHSGHVGKDILLNFQRFPPRFPRIPTFQSKTINLPSSI